MNKILNVLVIIIALNVSSKIEILDRVAVIVDDGVIMESQIKNTLTDIERRYVDQNIPMPPMNLLLEQITEKLIIEELQLQLADRAGVKISDSELNIIVFDLTIMISSLKHLLYPLFFKSFPVNLHSI